MIVPFTAVAMMVMPMTRKINRYGWGTTLALSGQEGQGAFKLPICLLD
jgi:hypothetical protein